MGNSFSDMLKRNKAKNTSVDITNLLEDTGTDSIIGKAKEEGRYLELSPDQLEPDPNQPRKTFDNHSLKELQQSIEARGQLQPILIGEKADNGKYPIISGERRWRAINNSEHVTTISAIIRSGASDELLLLLMQIDENNQREQVPAIENALAMQRVVDICKANGNDQTYAASMLGMSKSNLSKHLSLLKAPEDIKLLSLNNETQDVETLYNLSRAVKKDEKAVNKLVDKFRAGELDTTLRSASKELIEDQNKKKPKTKPVCLEAQKVFIEDREGQPVLVITLKNKSVNYELSEEALKELKASLA
ncbi:ParB/RepB/Spo0J family partition protein [Endozoicomonas sp. SM1973]|uniref:ParB/RepB/Spo0J family partition protein n=1 Tax=Spartinivicinus marinus TaxID=2994442 RepID=A0A853IJC0_9GAMM|nr:ParB/RepB/Spo0J family partition protein [Spartinivicinus marinus]NYZ69497.1 ParB/RepB/Spo0J family partition protein [Spartinivicinus marinus]